MKQFSFFSAQTSNYCKLVWFLFDIAASSSIAVDVLFWILLAPTLPTDEKLSSSRINKHVINGLLVVFDTLVVAFPTRLLHVVYPLLYAMLYSVFVVFLYLSRVNSKVYPFLDFEKNLKSAITIVIFSPLCQVLCHFIVFLLFKLKKKCHQNASLAVTPAKTTSKADIG